MNEPYQQKIQTFQMSYNKSKISSRLFVNHRFRVVWVRQGSCLWNIAGDICPVQKGDLVLLNNEEKRKIEQVTSEENLEFYAMEFEPRLLFDSQLLLLFTGRVKGYSHRVVPCDPAMIRLLEQISRESEEQKEYCQIILTSCVFHLLALAARKVSLSVRPNSRVNTQMKEVLTYIDKHYTGKISLDQLASLAHMSATGFSRYFTKYNGIGPSQYIKRKRIERAIYLLEHTDRTILDIALECGFQNASNFYKAFYSLTQHVPGDYRNPRE